MSTPPARRYALRLLVRYHDTVVEDRILPGNAPVSLDDDALGLGVPPAPRRDSLGALRWVTPAQIELTDGDEPPRYAAPGEPIHIRSGAVDLTISLVRQYRVVPMELQGDLFLLGAVALMMLLAIPLEMLLDSLATPGAQVPETSPELIARLLEDEVEGAESGQLYEERERPIARISAQDLFLPAGDKGPMDDLGGAANTAPERQRGDETRPPSQAKHQPLEPEPPAADGPEQVELPPIEGVTEPQQIADAAEGADQQVDPSELTAEPERGWGLRDWYDVEDARRDQDEIRRNLDRAEQLVRLDPESAWALQQLAYYQYLSEDYVECRRTYDRFIELYPDDPAGYNNLALVYKRIGEYGKEEGYYRLALALEPGDAHALNNLAVNLAHQQRFDEALEIMDQLDVVDPDDPYADLHRSKIHAARGENQLAIEFLEKALAGMERLDTLHHIEFRQDIRIDPAFDSLRQTPEFSEILVRYYGRYGEELKGSPSQEGRSG
ncbi:MAG: tetratricopeptide repeat protein [Alphaproteobacteria bacterium]|nr:tetratricopeptide repeat protein [Alphaproteobacteria bacterium]